MVDGDVSAEVISTDLDGIISEGEKLSQLDQKNCCKSSDDKEWNKSY